MKSGIFINKLGPIGDTSYYLAKGPNEHQQYEMIKIISGGEAWSPGSMLTLTDRSVFFFPVGDKRFFDFIFSDSKKQYQWVLQQHKKK
jgi:hypothetical protein